MARARATDEQTLIRAAARVFRANGYHNSTIDDIANAARVSRPTVYSYAKSKRWLLDRIVGELLDNLETRLEADRRTSETSHGYLRAVIKTHIEASIGNRTFYVILFSEETELSPAVRKRFRSWSHQVTTNFKELLDSCVDEGSMQAGLDPTVAANLIVSMLTSIHRWYDPKGPISPEQLVAQILMVIGGILERRPTAVATAESEAQ